MSIAVKPESPSDFGSSPLSFYRFSVKQYHRMIETGVLSENDRCELLEGLIVDKIRQSPRYACTISIVNRQLFDRLPEQWHIRVHSAITTRDSEPEPVIAVVKASASFYATRHPRSRDVGMIVEILDSTQQLDRTIEYRIYARDRIPVYWIVNLVDQQVEVYSEPRSGLQPRYQKRRDYSKDELVPLDIAGKPMGNPRERFDALNY